ncbi:hypothetical protein [Bradyrhizobium sp. BR 10261]|uniref:hypothetical protein n=1 Tax=Bradyrhizobium sp. BR 10261 TaxID=2749992 RepID=UPI001C64C828|nr:hypothetical protein [Bradyrhizobium sp. BR 10261]MBW7964955.1 hypothetical protein [Bradyrhizobium sp. BR 10261]
MFKPGTDTAAQQAGRARMPQTRAEDERLRREFTQALAETLGRPPTAAESIIIDGLASAHVKASRLRKRGRDDLEQLKVIASLSDALAKAREATTA